MASSNRQITIAVRRVVDHQRKVGGISSPSQIDRTKMGGGFGRMRELHETIVRTIGGSHQSQEPLQTMEH